MPHNQLDFYKGNYAGMPGLATVEGEPIWAKDARSMHIIDAGGNPVHVGGFDRLAKSATYTVAAKDRAKIIDCTSGTFTLSLTAAATLGSGFCVGVFNSGSGTVTVDPAGSETIRTPSGASTTIALTQGQGLILECDGSGWLAMVAPASLMGALLASNNLSDLANASAARTNLGLGTLATQSGTFSGTFSGTHSGTSSGTNTGDQTVTLTGDVTGSGTGSFAVTVAGLKGYVYGLRLAYVSSTSITVGIGVARDSTNAATITLSSVSTLSTATTGAINGIDRKTLTGTVATNSGNATVTGTSTLFLTELGNRTGTGTIAGASTTITGTGTKFLSEVAVGDLIGVASSSYGFARVTAIASDTSLTISNALVANPSGSTPIIIENATFQANAQTVRQINTITSNTSLTLSANSSATESGVAGYFGALPSAQTHLMVWLATGGSGTGCYLSTQRTTPFGITGYTTYVRRVGSIMWTGSAVIVFEQWGNGPDRWYQLDEVTSANGTALVAGGTATTWTPLVGSACTPPTTTVLNLLILSTVACYIRARNMGSATVSRNLQNYGQSPNLTGAVTLVQCDGAQCIDYAGSVSPTIYINVAGYGESL